MKTTIYVYGLADNLRYSLLRSPQWGAIKAWLVASNFPATWTPRLRGWCVRTERMGDLIALAERAGFVVKMKGAVQ